MVSCLYAVAFVNTNTQEYLLNHKSKAAECGSGDPDFS